MNPDNRRGRSILVFVAGIVVGTLLVGTAVAASSGLTASSFKYSIPKTGKLSLAPGAFAPTGLYGATNDYSVAPTALTNQEVQRCFTAGAQFPAGSKIVSITFYYNSDNTSNFSGE